MKTLTLIHTDILLSTNDSIFKHYLAISSDTIVVLKKTVDYWDVVEHIIVGSDTKADICEFDTIDDMLDVIHKVITVIQANDKIILSDEFYIIN